MIIDDAKNMQKHLVELREDFQRHPEVSCQEKTTAARVVKELQAIGGCCIEFQIKSTKGGRLILLRRPPF